MQTVNGLDCKWIGRRPVLQTVINNSRCRAKADGIAQTPRHPPSAGTLWISYMSVPCVMNTNLSLPTEPWPSSLENKEKAS